MKQVETFLAAQDGSLHARTGERRGTWRRSTARGLLLIAALLGGRLMWDQWDQRVNTQSSTYKSPCSPGADEPAAVPASLRASSKWTTSEDTQLAAVAPHSSGHMALKTSLLPYAFQPLPLGSIKPLGWLNNEMLLSASGLAGNEYTFYDFVHDSSWLGGSTEYSTLNEGFPYWFNGLVPLAYSLDDATLKAQVDDAVTYVILHQQADGWLGPETDSSTRDIWGRYPLFLGLTQLLEANTTYAPTVVPAMYKYIDVMYSLLQNGTAFTQVWGQARYADMIMSLQWLFENYPRNNSAILFDSMNMLMQHGLDWAGYFTQSNYLFADLDTINIDTTTADFGFVHGVNAGQGLKTGAVNYRFTGNQSEIQSARTGVNWTFTYHGAASGTILGDERESGLSPVRGSELCTAVETMFSLSYLYHAIGDREFADRCELAAFNAMPVMLTPDHWAHQYVAQPNQPFSHAVDSAGLFWNVNDYGQTYGLEPDYPCCTVNHPQGYPKFLSASYVRVGLNGLGHALLGPASVSTTLNGSAVTISCDTDYPFVNTLVYSINATVPFPFYIRVPGWSSPSASLVSVNSGPSASSSPDPSTGMVSVDIPVGASQVTLMLAANVRVEQRANSTIAVHYGALLYALDVGQVMQAGPPLSYNTHTPFATSYPIPPEAHDYTINNTLPWNIAIDPSTLVYQASNDSSSSLANPIWAPEGPPNSITAKGCQIDWPLDHGVPAPVPGNRTCLGAAMSVVLRPYGSMKIHMAEFPTVDLSETP